MSSQRKFFVGGNWKMNGNKQSIDGIVAFLNSDCVVPDVGELVTVQNQVGGGGYIVFRCFG